MNTHTETGRNKDGETPRNQKGDTQGESEGDIHSFTQICLEVPTCSKQCCGTRDSLTIKLEPASALWVYILMGLTQSSLNEVMCACSHLSPTPRTCSVFGNWGVWVGVWIYINFIHPTVGERVCSFLALPGEYILILEMVTISVLLMLCSAGILCNLGLKWKKKDLYNHLVLEFCTAGVMER